MEENGKDSHAMQTEENVGEVKESHGAEEEAMEPEETLAAVNSVKGGEEKSKRRGRKKLVPGDQVSQKKTETKEPATPLLDRPARERKSIERFSDSVEKEKVKEFKIEKGSGTRLKDIPNVVFKLSKRKGSDESVQLLHKLIYGKRVKQHHVKTNILQFSGFVWGANEEKEKAKMKEKLEKCVKESLRQVSDLLDLSISKATTKKEDVVLKLFEFLDSPYKTTEKLVQEEEQKFKKKKRSRTPTKGTRKRASGQTPHKRQKHEPKSSKEELDQEDDDDDEVEVEEEPEEVPRKKKRTSKSREPNYDAISKSSKKRVGKSAKRRVKPEEEPEEVEPDEEEPEEKHVKRKSSFKSEGKESDHDVKSISPKKGMRKATKKQSVYEPREEDLEDETEPKIVKSKHLSKVSKKQAAKVTKAPVESLSKERKKTDNDSSKVFSRKKKREEQEKNDVHKKETHKKARGADQPNTEEESKPTSTPSDEELRAAICDLLRDADFSTVTFTDVVKQLGAKFDADLSQNKAHVKILIQEEISKIVDEDDGEGEEEDTGAEDNAGKEVKDDEPEPAQVAAED